MTAIPVPQTVPGPVDEVFYPSEDGEPLAESEAHLMVILTLIATLRQFYFNRPDHYVIGDMFLYWEEGHPEARKAPDVMVVKGVEPKPLRNFFKTWEERATPAVIFEITSPSTADEDIIAKFELYQRLGVKEYFLFDPRHEYLDQPLLGYRLIGGRYEALRPSADGCLVSSELQMKLCPEGSELALIDFKTGKRVPTPAETHQLWKQAEEDRGRLQQWAEQQAAAAEHRAAAAEHRADEAEHRADEAEQLRLLEQQAMLREQQRAEEAERRAAELTAELARLRSTPPG